MLSMIHAFALMAFMPASIRAAGFGVPAEALAYECPIRREDLIVRGASLNRLLDSGKYVALLRGWYKCHIVKKGDIVAFRYSGSENTVAKIVRGLPGDKFRIRGRTLRINGKIARNSQGKAYLLDARRRRILGLYARTNRGTVPRGAYLVLGEMPRGSVDSTEFGFLPEGEIIGKVVKK